MNRSNLRYKLHERFDRPDKQLSPIDVVQILLMTLRHTDEDSIERSLFKCYSFISPVSRFFVGPIGYFKNLVQDTLYKYLLNHVDFRVLEIEVGERSSLVTVKVYDRDCEGHNFLFLLTLQEEECAGCWMVDLVEYQESNSDTYKLN